MQPLDTPGSTKLTAEQSEWFAARYFDKHGRGVRYVRVADGSLNPHVGSRRMAASVKRPLR